MKTDNTIHNNKPDIIIRDKGSGTCLLRDTAILRDRNVIKQEAENILKYKDLTIEIQRMWDAKTNVIPVTIISTLTISKSFRKYLETRHQGSTRNSHIGHCAHTSKSSNIKVQNVYHGKEHYLYINCNQRTSQHYIR